MWSNMQYITMSPWKIWNNTVETEKKLEFRGHVYFQEVHPQVVDDNLFWNSCISLARYELTISVY